MKLSAVAFLLLVSSKAPSVAGTATTTHLLRTKQDPQPDVDAAAEIMTVGDLNESVCNAQRDQDSCFQVSDEDGTPCQWCIAGAIPSECMSAAQSKMLPEGVFECVSPSHASTVQQTFEFPTIFSSSGTAPSQRFTLQTNAPEPTKTDLCDSSSASLSGYMDIRGSQYDQNGENKHLFFWMFEKRGDYDDDTPFVVWLTGGPGCSSTLALLTENGPCKVNKDAKGTTVNPASWTEAAHVLWLDQPAGVGFSYGQETDSNEEMIAEDAYYFLQVFFQTYPAYQTSPLYIVGESYGGHYAPAIAHRIWKGNQAKAAKTIPLRLSGLGVGNGLTDPVHQYPAYVDFATNNSHGIHFLSDEAIGAMKQVVPHCVQMIQACNSGDSLINDFACQSAFLLCNSGLTSPYQMTGLNPYDIRKQCEVPPLCYDFSFVQAWLNRKETKLALHVDAEHSHSWSSCNFGINMKFHTDWMKDFSHYVADLLNDGIPALIYAGDVDFICNYMGSRAWTLALDWNGSDAFQAASEHDWKGAGLARTAQGLTYLQVYDAGHMVPTDQPEVALDMIANFLQGGAF